MNAEDNAFVERPLRLSEPETAALLGELCVRLGYCLTPDAQAEVIADPPTDPRSFAERVVELELGAPGSPQSLEPVLAVVLATFTRVADSR